MAYDDASLTTREKLAAENQTKISKQNIKDVQHQLKQQLANYDFADRQNRALADTQLQQISRKNSADRFEQQRNLQNSALGLMGSMGSAMNGSTTGNFMSMLRSRNDADNNTYWAQLQENQDQVENAYNDSLNQNNVARRDAMQSADKAIRDISADWSANMNNINPKLFGKGDIIPDSKVGSGSSAGIAQNNARMSGYVIPDNRGIGTTPYGQTNPSTSMNVGATRNTVGGNDYFAQLMNRFNRR